MVYGQDLILSGLSFLNKISDQSQNFDETDMYFTFHRQI
jgi:hypothetical protein